MQTDELQASLFDGQAHPLAAPMAAWLNSSHRYAAFVTENLAKIRKKLRSTREKESLLDLRLELETPYLLLSERTLSVAYEPHQSEKRRSPDFAVSYTTSLTFMLEVTRLRPTQQTTHVSGTAPATMPAGEDLTDAICSKLGQLLPQRSNILIVGVQTAGVTQQALREAMLRLQQRAERNDPALFQRHAFLDRADFFQKYKRLSEIILRDTELRSDMSPIIWANPQAKHPLPSKVRTALYRSHAP